MPWATPADATIWCICPIALRRARGAPQIARQGGWGFSPLRLPPPDTAAWTLPQRWPDPPGCENRNPNPLRNLQVRGMHDREGPDCFVLTRFTDGQTAAGR
jgi:hypothetical protein